jgi:hypothetical protein
MTIIECKCQTRRTTQAGLKAAGISVAEWRADCTTCWSDKTGRAHPSVKAFYKEAVRRRDQSANDKHFHKFNQGE